MAGKGQDINKTGNKGEELGWMTTDTLYLKQLFSLKWRSLRYILVEGEEQQN